MREGKKRRNEERQEGPYKGAEGTRELVVALVPERKQTNKPRKAQTVTETKVYLVLDTVGWSDPGPLAKVYCVWMLALRPPE